MNFSDDGYAAMLLTMALSPDREEYARPYSTQEFRKLESDVRESEFRRLGRLLNMDISGLMLHFGLSEAEGYRTYTLLNRTVQLSYALENLSREGIDVATCYDVDYPQRLIRKLGDNAPPFLYRCGEADLFNRPAVAAVGIRGIRTDDAVREALQWLVRSATQAGYAIITGGEAGVSRLAASIATECGGTILDVVGGSLSEHIGAEGMARMIATGRGAAISLVHPRAMFTLPHAVSRNRVLFSLADAAFIFNTDGRRGENEALQNRYCDWVYAWTRCQDCQPLISRGAIPLNDVNTADFSEISRHWNSSSAEQMNIFDLL